MHEYYVHTRYTGMFSIRGGYPQVIKSSRNLGNTFANTDINGFRSPNRPRCPQIVLNAWLVLFVTPYHVSLPINGYIHKSYTPASSSSCLFI